MMALRAYRQVAFAFAVAAGAGGCGTNIPKAKFYHPQHGEVTSDDARLTAVREACGKTVYAQGITINGKVVTSRDEALSAWSQHLVDQAMPPGAGAVAGMQGALAVSSGDPSLATQTSGSTGTSIQKPDYDARLNALEKETWVCVEQQGWTKQKPS